MIEQAPTHPHLGVFTYEGTPDNPLASPSAQSAFGEWGEINGCTVEFTEGTDTESRVSPQDNGTGSILTISPALSPGDLPELVGVIDSSIYGPESGESVRAMHRLQELGGSLIKVSQYIVSQMDEADPGWAIAKSLADDIRRHGSSLTENQNPDNTQTTADQLTPEEKLAASRWLLGENLHESRMSRVNKVAENAPSLSVEELREDQMQKTIKQFFRTADRAFRLQKRDEIDSKEPVGLSWDSTTNHNWLMQKTIKQFFRTADRAFRLQKRDEIDSKEPAGLSWDSTTIHDWLIEGINHELKTISGAPEAEVWKAIHRKGLQLLLDEMPAPEMGNEHKKLKDYVRLDLMKEGLKELRETGDTEAIAQEEKRIADVIQSAIAKYSYGDSIYEPASIVKSVTMNCVGASMTGYALMQEVGLKCVAVSVPEHSMMGLVTSNGEVQWREMQVDSARMTLDDSMFTAKNPDGNIVTGYDIANGVDSLNFSATLEFNPESHGNYRLMLPWVKEGSPHYISVSHPESGITAQVTNSLGSARGRKGEIDEAIKVLEAGLKVDPNDSDLYVNLGFALIENGEIDEAIKVLEAGLKVDPNDSDLYVNLGLVLIEDNEIDEAIKVLKAGLEVDPNKTLLYVNLGDALIEKGEIDKAIKVLEAGLEVDPNKTLLYVNLGFALIENGELDEAIKVLKKGLEVDPNKAALYVNLGFALIEKDELDKAISVLEAGLWVDADNISMRVLLKKLRSSEKSQSNLN